MKYSLVNYKKVEAFPGGRGICQCCQRETIAKCGSRVIHHWAHNNRKHCDNWWENETAWHRQWKSMFPTEWQEIVHFDKATGEKHIADVKTDSGFVLEFQNSPMSLEELQARESFYKKMLWIVNGENFKRNFFILNKLPKPNEEMFFDIAFCPTKKEDKGKLYWKFSENPDWDQQSDSIKLFKMYNYHQIEKHIEAAYVGHHLFDWKRPKAVWYDSTTHVYFDFGDNNLWKLMEYGKNKVSCVRRIDKSYFIKRALEETQL